MTREEQLREDLREIMTRQPTPPQYSLTNVEKDTAMAMAWNEAFAQWSNEFDTKLAELEEELSR